MKSGDEAVDVEVVAHVAEVWIVKRVTLARFSRFYDDVDDAVAVVAVAVGDGDDLVVALDEDDVDVGDYDYFADGF